MKNKNNYRFLMESPLCYTIKYKINETNRLIHLVEELLDFLRLELNHLHLYREKVPLHHILHETIWQLKPKAGKNRLKSLLV
ncbi:hypothetical protein [Bacillus mycoides]|uniref:hypothetical protein n=1 Tax=Bacillus mycoides TaxID=1405 RepID=UPI00389AA8CD